MGELLNKWLLHYDPIHRGYTPAGITNGNTATNGWAFPRVRGGYNLYRGTPTAEQIDPHRPVGAAGASATSIRNFTWRPHAPATTYEYVCRAIGGGGVESAASAPVPVAFDAGGALLGRRPNGPQSLAVFPAAGGTFELRWIYVEHGQQTAPDEFRIYSDAGSGMVDFATAVGTVAYRPGRVRFRFLTAPVAHDQRRIFAVRAASAGGAEDGNTATAFARSDAAAPPHHPALWSRRVAEIE